MENVGITVLFSSTRGGGTVEASTGLEVLIREDPQPPCGEYRASNHQYMPTTMTGMKDDRREFLSGSAAGPPTHIVPERHYGHSRRMHETETQIRLFLSSVQLWGTKKHMSRSTGHSRRDEETTAALLQALRFSLPENRLPLSQDSSRFCPFPWHLAKPKT